ncbi:unnamed protein product [Durusdinium trenchii]|uniref:Transposase n=2 Tax=Durusdinium trenchii TaxID=1381693 RepID=A0ABP0J023_9DINO
MIPNWEKRLFETRRLAVEEEAERRRKGRPQSEEMGKEHETARRSLFSSPSITDQICFELIREMDLRDRAERIHRAAKPGLSKALTEAGLLRSKRVWPQRKILPEKPHISAAAKWKAQAFEAPPWRG